jgi:hypothetical protein
MTRIRFEDLPSTNTPRNAENLNKLNNVVISPTEPTTGEEVWIDNANKKIYTKNDNDVYEEFNNVIVESGSNENGNWVKYADGRMECWQRFGETLTLNVEAPMFGGMIYYNLLKARPFSQPFTELNSLIMDIESSGNGYALFLMTTGNTATLTHTCPKLVMAPVKDENDYVIISYHAIGRWK